MTKSSVKCGIKDCELADLTWKVRNLNLRIWPKFTFFNSAFFSSAWLSSALLSFLKVSPKRFIRFFLFGFILETIEGLKLDYVSYLRKVLLGCQEVICQNFFQFELIWQYLKFHSTNFLAFCTDDPSHKQLRVVCSLILVSKV